MWRAYGRGPYSPGAFLGGSTSPDVALFDSTFIASGAATSTTQRLTGLTGTFTAGRISDDTNPLPSIDIGSNGNTELEWAIRFRAGIADSTQYEFRVTVNGTPLDTYSQTPVVTIGTPPPPDYPFATRHWGLSPDPDLEYAIREWIPVQQTPLLRDEPPNLVIGATEGGDTSSISLAQNNRLTISPTEGADTSSVTLAQNNRLTVATTEGADTSSITLAQNNRLTVAATEGGDTSSVTLSQNNRLSIASTEDGDTSSITLAQNNRLTVSATEGDDNSSITLQVGSGINLNVAATEGDDSSSITLAQNNRLTVSPTEGADTSSVTLTQNNRLTISPTEGDDTSDITLQVGSGRNLNIAATEGNDSSSISLAQNNRLTFSPSEENDTSSISLSVNLPANLNIVATEGDDTAQMTFSVAVQSDYYGSGKLVYQVLAKWEEIALKKKARKKVAVTPMVVRVKPGARGESDGAAAKVSAPTRKDPRTWMDYFEMPVPEVATGTMPKPVQTDESELAYLIALIDEL